MLKETRYRQAEPIIERFIKNVFRGNRHMDDLIQEGKIYVWQTIDKWDPNRKGARFETWVQRAAYLRARRYLEKWSPIPAEKAREAKRLEQDPTSFGAYSPEKLAELRSFKNLSNPASLYDLYYSSAEEEVYLVDTLYDKAEEEAKRKEDFQELIKKHLKKLDPEKQLVIYLHDVLGVPIKDIAAADGQRRTLPAITYLRTQGVKELKGMLCPVP